MQIECTKKEWDKLLIILNDIYTFNYQTYNKSGTFEYLGTYYETPQDLGDIIKIQGIFI